MNQNQEAFNVVVTHLRKQGSKSFMPLDQDEDIDYDEYSEDELADIRTCAYRGDNGKQCAVGCLIGEEFYTLSLENRLANHSFVKDALIASGWDNVNPDMLREMQGIHDQATVSNWEKEFKLFAANHNLTLPEAE